MARGSSFLREETPVHCRIDNVYVPAGGEGLYATVMKSLDGMEDQGLVKS